MSDKTSCEYVYIILYITDYVMTFRHGTSHFLHSAGILTPSDEFQYWADLSESTEKSSLRERSQHFTEHFKPIQKV